MEISSIFAAVLAVLILPLYAQNAAPKPQAPALYTPDNYLVTPLPANIAPTAPTQPKTDIKVEGQPRKSEGHPCTILDKQDLTDWKKRLETDKDMQASFAKLKEECDARIAKPLGVPVAEKSADGSWAFPGDVAANNIPKGKVGSVNEPNAVDIAKLGTAFQLSGDAKYGDYAKKMILAYADNFPNYGHPKDWTEKNWRSQQDLRLTGQFLEDGFFLANFGYGYDMVRELFSAEEAKHVHDDLLVPVVNIFKMFAAEKQDYLDSPHNRSAMCTMATLVSGYASDDADMVNLAMYGVNGTPENPGGLMGYHFSDKCLLPDGLWIEGAPGYQLSIVSAAIFNDAETLWHHGIDMYRYRGGALKRLLDSNLILANPDEKMTEPMLHDCGPISLFDPRGWFNNEVGVPYEYGYRRYQDPSYVPIINNASKPFAPTAHAGAPTLFQDLPAVNATAARPIVNANFYSVGCGLLRLAAPEGTVQLLQEYGPSAGHAHPSKLGIDVFAMGAPLIQFPGSIFPYNHPLDGKWFNTTLSNSVMEVDEASQLYYFTVFKMPRGTPTPEGIQLLYAPAASISMQRAFSNTIYPGIVQDRSLFLAPEYVADIFGSFSAATHKYDLVWHLSGDLTSTLKGDAFQFDPSVVGYNALETVTKASSDKGWDATIATPAGKTARFVAAGGTATDVFFATGPKNQNTGSPATIIQRREGQANAVFANAVDFSNAKDGFIKTASQEGDLDKGYALLKLETVKGTDLCFAAYKPGSYKAGGLETDAIQAFVRMDGANVKALYLGGGTKLISGGASIQRSESGLAYVEQAAAGKYTVGNPSPTKATITLTVPGMTAPKTLDLDSGATAEVP